MGYRSSGGVIDYYGRSIPNVPDDVVVTYSGAHFSLTDQSTWVFDIQDIAKALSNMCRYTGHVEFYSVAEHLVRVAQYLADAGYPKRVQLAGLLHDAHEAYTSDCPAPFKRHFTVLGRPLKEMEDEVTSAIYSQFGIIEDELTHNAVEQADRQTFYSEYAERPNVGRGLTPRQAEGEFMLAFYSLSAHID